LAETDNRDSKPKRPPRRSLIRLTRNIFVYYRKPVASTSNRKSDTESYANKARRYVKDFCDRIEKEAWDRPIEFIGLLILFAYTTFAGLQSCRMGEANKLTQQIVRSTVSASLSCAASSAFSRRKADEPMTGAFYVTCNNVGKVAANAVEGKFTLTVKSWPDERILDTESWSFGGSDSFIAGSDGNALPFFDPKFSPDQERASIVEGNEIVVGETTVSYTDETGQRVTRRFCQVEMNWTELSSSPDSWAPCQHLLVIKKLREFSEQQKKQKSRQ
jgi:hypothetical protein